MSTSWLSKSSCDILTRDRDDPHETMTSRRTSRKKSEAVSKPPLDQCFAGVPLIVGMTAEPADDRLCSLRLFNALFVARFDADSSTRARSLG